MYKRQGLWFFAILYFQFNKKSTFKVTFGGMKLDPAICRTILWQGLPLFLVQVASLVYTIVINNYLGSLGGDPDLAAFSVINGYVVYLLDILCLSATYGLQPIASFNCGARRFDRLSELVKVSLGGTLAVLAVVCGLVIAFAEPISAFFIGDDPQLIELTASHFLPLLAVSYTHLDVYKRQMFLAVSFTSWSCSWGVLPRALPPSAMTTDLPSPF